MGAAYALRHSHHVVFFESAPQLGGHARTIMAGINNDMPVDTGFLVFNNVNYPLLTHFFDELSVPIIDSDMSFGASIDGGWLEYGVSCLTACNRGIKPPGKLLNCSMSWSILVRLSNLLTSE